MKKNCLVLTQSREKSEYNDFIGSFYHFPKKYLGQFTGSQTEFIYYEPTKGGGEGVYFGYGKIAGQPAQDKKDPDNFFVPVSDYKSFMVPVSLKANLGKHLPHITTLKMRFEKFRLNCLMKSVWMEKFS